MKLLLKAALAAVILFWIWNTLTCQHCPKEGDLGPWQGSAMTMQECSVYGNENTPITYRYVMVGYEVHVWMPFVGCIVNDPAPVEVFGFRVEGWFKGWHQVKIVHLRYGG